ncbi:MAG: redox-sensing transcriptional repressor Rex [Bacteroidales bacterium]|nr:redox-sensing transcriptional repressor Rex [Bacteroidales bacterium]
MNNIPEKTVERLSLYRRVLIDVLPTQDYIYSHELASLLHLTPVQVRRDLMLIGYNGTLRKGYNIQDLLQRLSDILDSNTPTHICIVGMGNLGRAITGYFNGRRSKLRIVAAFDNDVTKTNRIISGIQCYSSNEMYQVIKKENISIGIITTPPEVAATVCEQLVASGIKGIMNYTPARLKVPESVFLEEYDMITSLEKLAFYIYHA